MLRTLKSTDKFFLGERGFSLLGNCYLTKSNPYSWNDNTLTLKDGCAFAFRVGNSWKFIENMGDIKIRVEDYLDVPGALKYGHDYFVYLVLDKAQVGIVISENSTWPEGYDDETSRKIGGFHFGAVRVVSDDGLCVPVDGEGNKFGSSKVIWQKNVTKGIVPNSVWDLANRPRTLFGSMVKVGLIWVSIYQASMKYPFSFMDGNSLTHVAEGELQSQYGAYPVSGIYGLCQYNFTELSERAGMRLLTYQEFLMAAYGAPQGHDHDNEYGWTDVDNKVRARCGCSVDLESGNYDPKNGAKPYAVSAMNVVDTTGNVWEWLGEYTNRHDAASGDWTYYDQLGKDMGQIYGWKTDSFSSLAAGGHWHRGSYCGARAINPDDQPWKVNVHIGTRLCCPGL